MNIDIVSDLHIEFWDHHWMKNLPFGNSPYLICAGDLGEFSRPKTVLALEYLCNLYDKVFYVPGNHDYYGSNFDVINKYFDALESTLPHLKLLRTGVIDQLGDYLIMGDTLWIPDHPWLNTFPINDPYQITELRPAIFKHHHALRDFLLENVNEKTIVVTHHLPHQQSIAPQYMLEPTNKWFLGDCEDIIKGCKPAIWIHGHTHTMFDYKLQDTRIICNPLGYPGEYNYRIERLITYDI